MQQRRGSNGSSEKTKNKSVGGLGKKESTPKDKLQRCGKPSK